MTARATRPVRRRHPTAPSPDPEILALLGAPAPKHRIEGLCRLAEEGDFLSVPKDYQKELLHIMAEDPDEDVRMNCMQVVVKLHRPNLGALQPLLALAAVDPSQAIRLSMAQSLPTDLSALPAFIVLAADKDRHVAGSAAYQLMLVAMARPDEVAALDPHAYWTEHREALKGARFDHIAEIVSTGVEGYPPTPEQQEALDAMGKLIEGVAASARHATLKPARKTSRRSTRAPL